MSSERKTRGSSTIRDVAMAVAVAKCVIARDLGGAAMGTLAPRFFHPQECAFCEMDPEYLRDAVEEFNRWAGLVPSNTYDPGAEDLIKVEPSVESFMILPREEQAFRVQKAQGYR